jgi:hypothetical protein
MNYEAIAFQASGWLLHVTRAVRLLTATQPPNCLSEGRPREYTYTGKVGAAVSAT